MGSGISSRPDPYALQPKAHAPIGVLSSSLPPDALVYQIKDLHEHLCFYQNLTNGKLLISLDEAINSVYNLDDPKKWVRVFLADEAVDYLKNNSNSISPNIATTFSSTLAAKYNANNQRESLNARAFADSDTSNRESPIASINKTDMIADAKGSSIHQEKDRILEKDIEDRRQENKRETHLRDSKQDVATPHDITHSQFLLVQTPMQSPESKSAARSSNLESPLWSQNSSQMRTTPAERAMTVRNQRPEGGFDIIMPSNSPVLAQVSGSSDYADTGPIDGTLDALRVSSSSGQTSSSTVTPITARAVCQYCSQVLSIQMDDVGSLSLSPSSESALSQHSSSCVGLRRLWPGLLSSNQSLDAQLKELHTSNTNRMQKELLRAMKAFDTRCSSDNEVLLLLRVLIYKLQPDEMISASAIAKMWRDNETTTGPPATGLQGVLQRLSELDGWASKLLQMYTQMLAEKKLDSKNIENMIQNTEIDNVTSRRSGGRRLNTPDMGFSSEAEQLQFELKETKDAIYKLIDRIKLVEEVRDNIKMKATTIRNFLATMQINLRSFTFLQKLASGSFASIYLVKLAAKNAHYALKVLRKHPQEALREQREFVVREKRIMAAASAGFSDGFVQLQSAFETQNSFFFLMEFCPGGDLLNLLNRNKLIPEPIVCIIVAEICLAAKWLHTHGVIHRDIKPDNVFITAAGHVKLADFGISTNRLKKDVNKPSHRALFRPLRNNEGSSGDQGSERVTIPNFRRPGSSTDASTREHDEQEEFDSRIWHDMGNENEDFNLLMGEDYQMFNQLSDQIIKVKDKFENESKDLFRTGGRDKESSGDKTSSTANGNGRFSSTDRLGRGSSQSDQSRDRPSGHHPENIPDSSSSDGNSIYFKRSNSSTLHFTKVGNVHYLSPECVAGSGYDHMADWWAVGVLTFHLLTGVTPFENRHKPNMTQDEIRDFIVKADIVWDNLVLTAEETTEVKSNTLKDFHFNFNSFSKSGEMYAGNAETVHTDPTTGKTEVRLSNACRYFILDILTDRKKDRLGYRNGAGAKDVLFTTQSYKSVGSNSNLAQDGRDSYASNRTIDSDYAERSPRSHNATQSDGVLDHDFFANVNIRNLFRGKGPLAVSVETEGDTRYCRRSDGSDPRSLPSFWKELEM